MTEIPKAPKVPEDWKESKLDAVKRELGNFCASLPAETEVVIYTFDTEVREGPRVTILGDQQRGELREFFSGLKAAGKETHLWESLGFVLAKVSQAVRATPGKTVRVFVHTDGEDNDPTAPNPEEMLRTYEELIKNQARVTYLTLGFTLRSEIEQLLKRHGVRVRPSLTAADVIPPTASFSWRPRQPVAGEEVQFVDHSGGVIRDYAWDFADGTPASSHKAPTHVYQEPGEYQVVQKVTSPTGEADVDERALVVAAPQPIAALFRKPPAEVSAGTSIQFVNESKGSIESFRWDFGDGTTSTELHPVHAFTEPGTYTVSLTVAGPKGEKDAYQLPDAVRVLGPEPPQVDFVAPSSAQANEVVRFIDRSQGLIHAFQWDFGDGSPTSTERDPTHKYAKPGKYTVTLTARGPGGENSGAKPIEVVLPPPPPAPVAHIEVGSPRPRAGDPVNFTDASTGVVSRARWEFGDGTERVEVDYAAEKRKSVTHTFAEPGKYAISLVVEGPGGKADDRTSVEVSPRWLPPEAKFTARPARGRAPLAVRFTNESQGTISRYVWDFGDGSPPLERDSLRDEDHTYQPGTYTVTLRVVGPEKSGESKDTETIEVKEPLSWFGRNWLWVVPLVIILLGAIGALAYFLVRQILHQIEYKRLCLLTGICSCKSALLGQAAWKPFEISGEDVEFSFPPAESLASDEPQRQQDQNLTAVLGKSVDPETLEESYTLELRRDGASVARAEVQPNEDVSLGGYVFRYQPS